MKTDSKNAGTTSAPGWRGYLVVLILSVGLPAGLGLGLNLLVDPLWYGSGSLLFRENFPYNERYSKGNLFLRSYSGVDCLILGSSRTTLLDASQIRGHHCFNFSVSNGIMLEYPDIVSFVESKTDVALVIAGVDGYNFSDHGLQPALPPFLLNGEELPGRVETYLSFDVLDFSLRSLLSRGQRTRFYDHDFACDTMHYTKPFPSPTSIDPRDPNGGLAESPTNTVGPFRSDSTAAISAVRSLVPDATLVGYVPPLAAHHVAHMAAAGNLNSYLTAIWNASRSFDRFYDFSVPSTMTENLNNTYDGSHFYRLSNDLVAETISGGELHGSIPLHETSFDEYRRAFESRLQGFVLRAYPESS